MRFAILFSTAILIESFNPQFIEDNIFVFIMMYVAFLLWDILELYIRRS